MENYPTINPSREELQELAKQFHNDTVVKLHQDEIKRIYALSTPEMKAPIGMLNYWDCIQIPVLPDALKQRVDLLTTELQEYIQKNYAPLFAKQ